MTSVENFLVHIFLVSVPSIKLGHLAKLRNDPINYSFRLSINRWSMKFSVHSTPHKYTPGHKL